MNADTLKDKLMDVADRATSKSDFALANALTPSNEKPHGTSFSARILPTSIGATASLGTALAYSHILKKMGHTPIPKLLMAGLTLGGGALGYTYPEINNAILSHKRGESTRKDVDIAMRDYNKLPRVAVDKLYEHFGDSKSGIVKKSSLDSLAIKGLKATGKVVGTTGKAILSGLKKTPKGAKFGEKAFGYITKGVALAGTGVAGSAIAKNVAAPRSQGNYQTFLRNNILAGNINPSEVPQSDAKLVNELGMR